MWAPAPSRRTPRAGAVVVAALIAALVCAALEMLLVALMQGQPFWAPLHRIAALVMGPGVLPVPPAFDLGVALVALGLHLALSLVCAAFLGGALLALRASWGWWIGLLFGAALHCLNFYGFTAVFPWFADARGGIALFSHAVFGLLLGVVYRAIDRRDPSRD